MKTDLTKYDACREAVEWFKQFKTDKEAWEACPRGDWMLWIAQKLDVDKRTLTLAKGKCVETVIHLMKDERSVAAIKAAIAYGKGEIDEEELKKAANAAYATDAHAAAYAANAAYAAAYAAAFAAANAAANAAYAAAAADAAAYAAAEKENQMLTANICREILTKEMFKD